MRPTPERLAEIRSELGSVRGSWVREAAIELLAEIDALTAGPPFHGQRAFEKLEAERDRLATHHQVSKS